MKRAAWSTKMPPPIKYSINIHWSHGEDPVHISDICSVYPKLTLKSVDSRLDICYIISHHDN
jgi:hypothetical protein